MVVGVISDTHGNFRLMAKAADLLHAQFGATRLYHLGDDYSDAVYATRPGMPVTVVPGLWCPEYSDSRIPHSVVEAVEGLDIACAHAPKDLQAAQLACAIVLTGHTHEPDIALLGRSLHVNPGHLKSETSRGQEASFAVLDIQPETVTAKVCALEDGRVIRQLTVERSRLG